MALKNDGTVWTWGSNLAGQLGDGTTNDRHYPGQVANLSGVKEIAGSIGAAYALLDDGRVAAWAKTGIDGIGYTRTPKFFAPSRPVAKIRASLHNWHPSARSPSSRSDGAPTDIEGHRSDDLSSDRSCSTVESPS
ncbi:RCC1 domain-containing protein [Microbacterium sp. VKM Ac-2923]|uniref:RCC1 domain-containing protein n=1 Tax=Microbacterium sp. VKM Ac-2923 TaxID=2929476 RepID=UPI001FB206E7|nr:RCC1 domain-containing protein [Microbacterium sp. VKM Ac-2923]MCJ1706261.1 RCC1 domain-containing protein [Microbacterium sp. VKM Ac-2923]